MNGLILASMLDLFNTFEKYLVGIGGFVVGAVLIGLFAQLLSLSISNKKIPSFAMMLIRVLGGIVFGWIMMLLVGKGGIFMGGPGTGGIEGKEEGKSGAAVGTREGTTNTLPGGETIQPTETLEIEVLGPDAIKSLKGKPGYDSRRIYRIRNAKGKKLLTLEEVKTEVSPTGETTPYRRILLRIYGDSPNSDKPQVTDLQNWARDFVLKDGRGKLDVKITETEELAPPATEVP